MQSLTVRVPNMQAAVNFWKNGMGALVTDTRVINGANVTRIGFGDRSLRLEDGAKFELELIESPLGGPSTEPDSCVLQYLQLEMPVFRASQALLNGAEPVQSYGWVEIIAPGGLP